ncbi:hypothetical protein H4219_001867 [Mycoemilia scoparia]|uniref:Zn(2)-C6 fungal-type domain-containing protein n=1 Tax=Mycoemilia scoparia TaxID=417184 RepID=A0A9W8A750_9FUNG|nr:hypothetical protein H4219_001867 [Mycoemilia scoparia]
MDQPFFIPDMGSAGDDNQSTFFASLGLPMSQDSSNAEQSQQLHRQQQQQQQHHHQVAAANMQHMHNIDGIDHGGNASGGIMPLHLMSQDPQMGLNSQPLPNQGLVNYENMAGGAGPFMQSPITPNFYSTVAATSINPAAVTISPSATLAHAPRNPATQASPGPNGMVGSNGNPALYKSEKDGSSNNSNNNHSTSQNAGDKSGSIPKTASERPKAVGMACAACRRRKIRCDGKQPRCSYCVKKGYECKLTPHKKRGRPRKGEQRGKAAAGASENSGDKTQPQPQSIAAAAASATAHEGVAVASHVPLSTTMADGTAEAQTNRATLTTSEPDPSSATKSTNPRAIPAGARDLGVLPENSRDKNSETGTGGQEPTMHALVVDKSNDNSTNNGTSYNADTQAIKPNNQNDQQQALDIQNSSNNTQNWSNDTTLPMLAELLAKTQGSQEGIERLSNIIMALASKNVPSNIDPSMLLGLTQKLMQTDPSLSMNSNFAFPQRDNSISSSGGADEHRDGIGINPLYGQQNPTNIDYELFRNKILHTEPLHHHSPAEAGLSPASDQTGERSHTPFDGEHVSLTSKALWQQLIDSAQNNKSGFVDVNIVRRHIPQEIDAGIKAYFLYVHPWVPILHRRTFESMVRNGTVDPLLYCCVQAIAARFKPDRTASQPQATNTTDNSGENCATNNDQKQRENTSKNNDKKASSTPKGKVAGNSGHISRRPYRRGRAFIRLAKTMLPTCARRHSLPTLQAVTLLTQYMSFSGNWREGAAYEKIAVQLAFNGQYHLLDEEFEMPTTCSHFGQWDEGWDMTDSSSVGGLLGASMRKSKADSLRTPMGVLEHEQKRRTWWSIFQMERFNGLAMGRPPIIKPGWHWVWLPCSESLWSHPDPTPDLAWELGLLDSPLRPLHSVSHCRIDLILALIMGQFLDYRTQMFRYFFPRLDQGTLLYDNLPTHTMEWHQRLRSLLEVVETLERRLKQWQQELDRYADTLSSRRHANFELLGYSVRIHVHACVLQIREHLIEDLETSTILNTVAKSSESRRSSVVTPTQTDSERNKAGSPTFNNNTSGNTSDKADPSWPLGTVNAGPFKISRLPLRPFETAYTLRAQHDHVDNRFLVQLDKVAHRSWLKCIYFSDEMARLVHDHWLRNIDESMVDPELCAGLTTLFKKVGPEDQGVEITDSESERQQQHQQPQQEQSNSHSATETKNGSEDTTDNNDISSAKHQNNTGRSIEDNDDDIETVADRFKLLNPQTPYHIFVAGKVQAARLKGIVTSLATGSGANEDPNSQSNINNDKYKETIKEKEAVLKKLDTFIFALEYSQLYWNSLDFATHLRCLRKDALQTTK